MDSDPDFPDPDFAPIRINGPGSETCWQDLFFFFFFLFFNLFNIIIIFLIRFFCLFLLKRPIKINLQAYTARIFPSGIVALTAGADLQIREVQTFISKLAVIKLLRIPVLRIRIRSDPDLLVGSRSGQIFRIRIRSNFPDPVPDPTIKSYITNKSKKLKRYVCKNLPLKK